MLGEASAGLDRLQRDIGLVLSRAAAATRAAALICGCWHICRDDIVFSVLLFPGACLGAVGNLLRAVGLQLHGVLLYLGKLSAVGGVVFRRPVTDLLLDRRLT